MRVSMKPKDSFKYPNPNYIPPLAHRKHSTKFDELILPNIVEAIFYKLSCPNCGWKNSINDLASFCPKCGKDLKCGRLVSNI